MYSFIQYIKLIKEDKEDYRGDHTAPTNDGYAKPMHDLSGIYPDDFYSHKGFKYYSHYGNSYDSESHYKVTSAKHRPAKLVDVYRAVPKDPKIRGINKGDWVTIHRKYAKEHGESNLNNKFRIIKKIVHARDLYTNGDSIHEWGYDPQPYNGEIEKHYKNKRLAEKNL